MKLTIFILFLINIFLWYFIINNNYFEWSKEFIVYEDEIKTTNITPDTSFQVHIIQLWWLHSSIHDWVYRPISSLEDTSPLNDASISNLTKDLLTIDYRWRKDYFQISCPEWFFINNCNINNNTIDIIDNSCYFYFDEESVKSDIFLTCNNSLFWNPY
jgi:hypothetical protein